MENKIFFDWLFKKKSYYVISIIYSLYVGLQYGNIGFNPRFLGNIIGSFLCFGIFYWLVWFSTKK